MERVARAFLDPACNLDGPVQRGVSAAHAEFLTAVRRTGERIAAPLFTNRATPTRTASPFAWPCRSLIALKRSRSKRMAQSGVWCALCADDLLLRPADEPATVSDFGQRIGLRRPCQIVERQIQLLERVLDLIEQNPASSERPAAGRANACTADNLQAPGRRHGQGPASHRPEGTSSRTGQRREQQHERSAQSSHRAPDLRAGPEYERDERDMGAEKQISRIRPA